MPLAHQFGACHTLCHPLAASLQALAEAGLSGSLHPDLGGWGTTGHAAQIALGIEGGIFRCDNQQQSFNTMKPNACQLHHPLPASCTILRPQC